MEEKRSRRRRRSTAGRTREQGAREKDRDAARHLEEAILAAVRERCRQEHVRLENGSAIELTLHAVVRGGLPGRLETAAPLAEQIDHAVREASAREGAFRSGRVYCYRCDSTECAHSAPPEAGRVFGGYSPTGMPLWAELVQLLVELRHPGAEYLYDPTLRHLAAAYVGPAALKERQLGIFGGESKTYDILGQVVCGFLWFPRRDAGALAREKTALTLQAAVIRDRRHRFKVVLNVLGRLSGGQEAVEYLEGPLHMRVVDTISQCRRMLARVRPGVPHRGHRGTPPRKDPVADAEGILRRTARALERLGRQSSRRTLHAETRGFQKRPTAKALEDAAGALDEQLFWDEWTSTVVVLGARGRAHVFSPEGRHITSLALRKEEVQGRRRKRRWRPLEGERRRLFREALEKVLPGR